MVRAPDRSCDSPLPGSLEILGHSRVSTTLETYSHVVSALHSEAAARTHSVLGQYRCRSLASARMPIDIPFGALGTDPGRLLGHGAVLAVAKAVKRVSQQLRSRRRAQNLP